MFRSYFKTNSTPKFTFMFDILQKHDFVASSLTKYVMKINTFRKLIWPMTFFKIEVKMSKNANLLECRKIMSFWKKRLDEKLMNN